MASVHLSIEINALRDLFSACPVGGTVTYAEMSDAIGRQITTCRYLAIRALDLVRDESGIAFTTIRSQGYRRLPVSEAAGIGSHFRDRVRRASRRAAKSMAAVLDRANDVDPDVRNTIQAEISAAGLIEAVARNRVTKTIAAADHRAPAPPAIAAQAFMSVLGKD